MKKNILKHCAVAGNKFNILPARQVFPEWYKKSGKLSKELPEGQTNFISCGPFTDSFVTGYFIPLAKDVVIKIINGKKTINVLAAPNPVLTITSLENNPMLPIPPGFSNQGYSWFTKNVLKIPKGYSALLTHPLNRYDLPFITLSAVVDGEMVLHNGFVPMFLKEGFEGTIKAGTPIIQVILFKTEDWDSEIDISLHAAKEERNKKEKSFYKKEIRKKKNYN
jgi:hypothetical protein